jgi:hypothetical protein
VDRVASGTLAEGTRGTGPAKDCAVAGMAAGMEGAGEWRAGAAFLVLVLVLGWEWLMGVSRPNDRPTADAPTTEAVAQSDGTVFILAENQAAGDSSLVEAGVTSCRALWHVKKPGDHRSRAARDGREEADG